MTSNLNIKNLYYSEKDVGKTIKSSKKYYSWEFVLNDKHRKIELFHSKVSAKRKIVYNGALVTEDEGSIFDSDFSYSFTLQKNLVNISQTAENKYEMKIGGHTFTYLMNEEKHGRLKYKESSAEEKKDKEKDTKETKDTHDKVIKKSDVKEVVATTKIKEKVKEKESKPKSSKREEEDSKVNFFDEKDFNFECDEDEDFDVHNNNMKNNSQVKFQSGNLVDVNKLTVPTEQAKKSSFDSNKNILNNLGIDFFAVPDVVVNNNSNSMNNMQNSNNLYPDFTSNSNNSPVYNNNSSNVQNNNNTNSNNLFNFDNNTNTNTNNFNNNSNNMNNMHNMNNSMYNNQGNQGNNNQIAQNTHKQSKLVDLDSLLDSQFDPKESYIGNNNRNNMNNFNNMNNQQFMMGGQTQGQNPYQNQNFGESEWGRNNNNYGDYANNNMNINHGEQQGGFQGNFDMGHQGGQGNLGGMHDNNNQKDFHNINKNNNYGIIIILIYIDNNMNNMNFNSNPNTNANLNTNKASDQLTPFDLFD